MFLVCSAIGQQVSGVCGAREGTRASLQALKSVGAGSWRPGGCEGQHPSRSAGRTRASDGVVSTMDRVVCAGSPFIQTFSSCIHATERWGTSPPAARLLSLKNAFRRVKRPRKESWALHRFGLVHKRKRPGLPGRFCKMLCRMKERDWLVRPVARADQVIEPRGETVLGGRISSAPKL